MTRSEYPTDAPRAPFFDRAHTDAWIGHFPGLGSVRVAADGTSEITVEPSPDESWELREAALSFGWAEPISFVRRGYQLATASAVTPPGDPGCLLLTGEPH